MSLSMKIALDLINEKKNDITLYDLGFIFTVLRDNATNLDVNFFLAECLDRLNEVK